MHGTAVQKM